MSKKLLAAALLPTAAFAQQLTIPVNPTMVVTATRVAQPASSVLAPVNVVTRDEIDRLQAQTVTDVVKTLPGVEVVSNGGRGQLSSLRTPSTSTRVWEEVPPRTRSELSWPPG